MNAKRARIPDSTVFLPLASILVALAILGGVVHELMWSAFREGRTRLPAHQAIQPTTGAPVPANETAPGSPSAPLKKTRSHRVLSA